MGLGKPRRTPSIGNANNGEVSRRAFCLLGAFLPDGTGTVYAPVDRFVVDHHDVPVNGAAYVELQAADPEP